MIRIDPCGLYTRADLIELFAQLGGQIDADAFVARIRPRKISRFFWLGEDLLCALRAAPALPDRQERPQEPAPPSERDASARARRAPRQPAACSGLRAYLKRLDDKPEAPRKTA